MSADFSDPHWVFIGPAYAVAAVILGALAFAAWRKADHWARRARDLSPGEASPGSPPNAQAAPASPAAGVESP